jgi:hypothetical protein
LREEHLTKLYKRKSEKGHFFRGKSISEEVGGAKINYCYIATCISAWKEKSKK